jgi:DNA-binding NarL/FixJ family response regulator
MRGSSNREIANCLNISERIVQYYMKALKQKLQAKNRLEVALAAQQRNLGHETDLPAAHWHGTGL